MDTKSLAAAIIGFLLGGLVVSTAAQLQDDPADAPVHGLRTEQQAVGYPRAGA
ncbi:MAG: hypothetical protein M3P83_02325 [Actinomycetota bacterium]|nr:hypothetical protein [Actinomycetota bacterium]